VDECRGTLVVHEDGYIECLDPGCTRPDPVRHEWRAACDNVAEPCSACAPPAAARRAA
jgi:hypothetical protein